MYIYVNLNSFFLAFKTYRDGEAVFAGFDNFVRVFHTFGSDPVISNGIKYSLLSFVLSFAVGMTFSLFFSYYVYKKKFLSGIFKVLLFAPSIISPLVMVTLYRYVVDSFIPFILREYFDSKIIGLLSDKNYVYGTVMFYCLFVGFGPRLLLFSNAMSGINESIIEAAHIDGVGAFGEFFYIVFPQIFSTVAVFVTTSFATIFTAQYSLYEFFQGGSDYFVTIGYYMYREVQQSGGDFATYPMLSAMGLTFTVLIAPIAWGIRKLMTKLDPMEEA